MIVPEFLCSSGNLQTDRRYEYACSLAEDGDLAAAIDLLEQTLSLNPHWSVLHFTLGKFYKAKKDNTRAI